MDHTGIIERWQDWPLILDGLFISTDRFGYYYLEDKTGHMLIASKNAREISKEIKFHDQETN